MLLTVSSMLMNQQYGTSRKRNRQFADQHVRLALEFAKVTSIVHDETMEKDRKVATFANS